MLSAKAKKKRQKQRQLDQKKKKSKLKEPIKKAEREARMLSKLKLAMVHLSNSYRTGKVTAHEEMDPGDEKALKALQKHTPPSDPTTSDSDMAALKPATPRLRKESADSSTPRVEQQGEMWGGMRTILSQKPPPSDVRPKSPIPIKLQQSPICLPIAVFSQKFKFHWRGKNTGLVKGIKLVTTAVTPSSSTLKFPKKFLKSEFSPPTKPNQPISYYKSAKLHHFVTVTSASVPLSQPVATPTKAQIGDQQKAEQAISCNKSAASQGKESMLVDNWKDVIRHRKEKYQLEIGNEPTRPRSKSCHATCPFVGTRWNKKETITKKMTSTTTPRKLLRSASETSLLISCNETPPPCGEEPFAEAINHPLVDRLIQTAVLAASKLEIMLFNPALKRAETSEPILTASHFRSL